MIDRNVEVSCLREWRKKVLKAFKNHNNVYVMIVVQQYFTKRIICDIIKTVTRCIACQKLQNAITSCWKYVNILELAEIQLYGG